MTNLWSMYFLARLGWKSEDSRHLQGNDSGNNAIVTAAPEEEFVNQLQVRPSCLQRWLVLFRVKLSTLGERSFSCRMMRQIRIQITEPSLGWSFYILSQLTEGLFVGGRALKRLTENMWTT